MLLQLGLAGTAAIVQAMVFGNLTSTDSASGVCFSRNPVTGDSRFHGEWLPKSQGSHRHLLYGYSVSLSNVSDGIPQHGHLGLRVPQQLGREISVEWAVVFFWHVVFFCGEILWRVAYLSEGLKNKSWVTGTF